MKILNEQRWTHEPRFAEAVMFGDDIVIGAGPWDDEPDKVQWVDGDTDLDCLAVRNHMGAWCGYVGVPPGHPSYGKYDDQFSVHGGITFASMCEEDAPEGYGICHIPLPGREPEVWWLGFDCGHFMDLQPVMAAREPELFGSLRPDRYGRFAPTYKPLAYVQEQCADLASQLDALADAS